LKLKIIIGALLALGASAAIASAAGVLRHEDPTLDPLQDRQEALEAGLSSPAPEG
jgi:hypothetical protein